MKILIIEDVPEIALALQIRLEKAGYVVITASDGEEGLRKTREEKPDLIILDLMLPKMDGYRVCRLIKFDKELEHIPVVILTVRDQERDKTLGREVGADAYIVKPYDFQELLTTIKKLLIPDDVDFLLKRVGFKVKRS